MWCAGATNGLPLGEPNGKLDIPGTPGVAARWVRKGALGEPLGTRRGVVLGVSARGVRIGAPGERTRSNGLWPAAMAVKPPGCVNADLDLALGIEGGLPQGADPTAARISLDCEGGMTRGVIDSISLDCEGGNTLAVRTCDT